MSRFRTRMTKRGPLPFRYVLLLSFVFFVFSTSIGLWIVNKGIKPTLMSYAESQTRKVAPMVINRAIQDVLPNVKDIQDIMELPPNSAEGTPIKFNTEIITRTAQNISRSIQANLRKVEMGNLKALEAEMNIEFDEKKSSFGEGIVYSVPLGQAMNNALLGNLGPRIPVRFTVIGDVTTNVKNQVEQYGINNVFIVVAIQIEVNVQIIIPFSTSVATVIQDVPVAMGYIPGKVPQFNNNGSQMNPSITLPPSP